MPEPDERLLGGAGGVDRRERGVLEHLGRDAEPADGLVESAGARAAVRRAAPTRVAGRSAWGRQAVGSRLVTVRSTGTANWGAFAAEAKVLIRPTVLCGSGLTRWKAWPSRSGLVGDVVHRLGDVVDRHHVGVAEVDADQGHPARQGVAHPLEQREEVVGAVDLVHRAGLGVPDHDRRTVDPPRDLRLLADDLLGLELGAVVRRGQPLALVEHRLVEDAAEVAGRRDRGDLVEVADLELAGQPDGVAGAADVHGLVHLVRGGHVVDRREVEEVLDVARCAR